MENDQSSSDEFRSGKPGEKSVQDFSHLVDELKQVMAGLNKKTPTDIPAVEPVKISPPEVVPQKKTSHQNGQAPSLPEDKEFWDGNVLGWPSETEKPLLPSEPPPVMKTPTNDKIFSDSASSPHGLSEIPDFSDFDIPVGTPSEPDPKSSFGFSDVPPGLREQIKLSPPPPPSLDPVTELDESAVSIVKGNGTPIAFSYGMPSQVPSVPQSNEDIPDFPVSPSNSKTSEIEAPKNSAVLGDSNFDVSPIPELQSNSDFPIPGTMTEKPKKEFEAFGEDSGYSDQSLKPANLIQVACIFPEGQEKNGQSFISRLRDAAEKQMKEVQPVFIEPWSAGSLDVSSWVKSAEISGADYMVVLCSKSDQETIKSLVKKIPINKIRTRVVLLEQISMKSLYADILIQLTRGRV